MFTGRYGISLLVFSLVRCAHSGDIELTTRRVIPYLRVPMYYYLYIRLEQLAHDPQGSRTQLRHSEPQ